MPYATCPNCGDTFHLLVTKDIDEWEKKNPKSESGVRYLQCFACWKDLKEHDVVRVCTVPHEYEGVIAKGDKAAVLMVLHGTSKTVYETECVNPDGSSKWVATLERQHLKFVPIANAEDASAR